MRELYCGDCPLGQKGGDSRKWDAIYGELRRESKPDTNLIRARLLGFWICAEPTILTCR